MFLLGDLFWTVQRFPSHCRGRIFSEADAPDFGAPVLVLGAGIYSDGEPTAVLEERLRTALDLYHAQKVTWFLVSGDNRAASYNEPQAMRRWLLKQGVPPDRVIADFAGRRTYDSLKRAQVVFGLRRLVVVTSDFHMARAIYLGSSLGLEVYGVPGSTREHTAGKRIWFWFREYWARHKALLDTWFPPATRLGPREPTPDEAHNYDQGRAAPQQSAP
ncbi:MAG: YdcF family protein [Acidobacteriota bacterium]|nr:YdcF family protein [Acidobacteriota bacterium]